MVRGRVGRRVVAFLVGARLRAATRRPAYPERRWPTRRCCGRSSAPRLLLALVALFALGVAHHPAPHRRWPSPWSSCPARAVDRRTGSRCSRAKWLHAGHAGGRIRHAADRERYDTAIGPLVGLAVLAAYAAVALGVATWCCSAGGTRDTPVTHRLRRAVHAEWTKLRTVPSTPGCWRRCRLATVAGGAGALAAVDTGAVPDADECFEDTAARPRRCLAGPDGGRRARRAGVTTEYGTGTIGSTLAAARRAAGPGGQGGGRDRGRAAGRRARRCSARCSPAGRILPGNGFTRANGYRRCPSPTDRRCARPSAPCCTSGWSPCSASASPPSSGTPRARSPPCWSCSTPSRSSPRWWPTRAGRSGSRARADGGRALDPATKELDELPIGPWPGLGVLAT